MKLWIGGCLLGGLIGQILSSPHVPEVVYPKKPSSSNLWAHAAAQNGVSKGKSSNIQEKNSGNTSFGMPVGPFYKARRKTYAQKQYNNTKETRIVLAPLEGEKIYTLEKYVVVSSEKPEKKEVIKARKGPKTALSGTKTKANVQELVALKRTTMSEFATSTTTTPRPRLIFGDVKMNPSQTKSPAVESTETQPKNSESPAAFGSHVHLVSHDTSKSAEIKFPAKNWQLPPALLAARIKSTGLDTARELNSVEDETLEEALELFSKTHDQLKSPHALSIAPRNKSSVSMADVLQKAFGETKPKPQMTFVDRQKFRATYGTHKADPQQIIPLPPTPFGDETDMDLLPEYLRNRQLLPSPIVPVPIITNPALSIPGPLSHLPTEMIVYNQHATLMPNYVGLDPNYKLDLCCKKQGVTAVCQAMCNFDTFTDRSLVTAVISNQCPGPQLGQAFDCASTKVDHTECCTRNNVHLYNAGQCMPFCRTHEPTPPNIFTYVACLSVFDTIKNCYREYQYTHPNIFGD